MMEKYQAFQTLCQIGIVVFTLLAALCGYGAYHYGEKKSSVQTQKDSLQAQSAASKIIEEINKAPKTIVHEKVATKNVNTAPALIVTQNQSGGQNVVNYSGDKFNPANISKRPIFDNEGYYGLNVLNESVKIVSKDTSYSFSAKIPVNTRLKVTLQRIGENAFPFWVMAWGHKNWKYNYYDHSPNFIQKYDLDDEIGEMNMLFRENGEIQMKIFYNDTLISEKIIKCQ